MWEGCNESWHNDVAIIQAKDRCCLGMIKADQHDEIVHYLHDDRDNIIDDELASYLTKLYPILIGHKDFESQ